MDRRGRSRNDVGAHRVSLAGWVDARRADLVVLKERMAQLEQEERDGYPRLAPDFLVEVMSVFDDPAYLLRKMDQWIANGVQVAWLIDPSEESVTIYRPGDRPEYLAHPTSVQGTGPIAGFELVMSRIWE